jgi:D-3-phosphoglycerate dehydrogenase
MPALRLVAVSRGGPVNIDLASARRRGVTVVNVPGRNASAVAEFTIGAILAETRLIRAGHESLRRGEWRGELYRADVTGRELSEMTVGIVGYGEIGRRVVRLLHAFGCRILVTDPYVALTAADRAAGVGQVAFAELLAASDVVSLHARVTPETTRMADAACPDAARCRLLNTARGPLVDFRLRGAMLETFAVEPPPADWPLLRLPNVTLTPHIAGACCAPSPLLPPAADEVRRTRASACNPAEEIEMNKEARPAQSDHRQVPWMNASGQPGTSGNIRRAGGTHAGDAERHPLRARRPT